MLHHLIADSKDQYPDNIAIIHKKQSWDYQQLSNFVNHEAQALIGIGLLPEQRVAIYLPKQIETVSSFFAVTQAGGAFVPINPVLKAAQVQHILTDCNVKILITSKARLQGLAPILSHCSDLNTIILVDNELPQNSEISNLKILTWPDYLHHVNQQSFPKMIDTSMAAILYTSGSTGKPKGVVLSHKNITCGAESVAEYLKITEQDRILAVLPFSFDYGLNQLMSSILQGSTCVILDFLLPRDVIRAVTHHQITGLAAVPPLWAQIGSLEWPIEINNHLRYMTNSGGKMPKSILDALISKVPDAEFYLMYGLTEAFRSTYLPPDQLKLRPDSMGKAIPNAEILVVKEDGSRCEPHETGELVHRGSLVALGYWNDPEKTAERFKPAPNQLKELPLTEYAVWSGDQVSMDDEGYLYFVGRKDDMLKTSGYRVSPTEIEELIYNSAHVKEAAAIGIPHDTLGQAIVVIISTDNVDAFNEKELINQCKVELANYMVPAKIIAMAELPKNPNGKIDRKALASEFSDLVV